MKTLGRIATAIIYRPPGWNSPRQYFTRLGTALVLGLVFFLIRRYAAP